jgi:diguanylate cyclase (GGDEF)-like protein
VASSDGGIGHVANAAIHRTIASLGRNGLLLCGGILVVAVAATWSPGTGASRDYLSDLMPVAVAAGAGGCAALVGSRSPSGSGMRRTWYWLAVALLLRAAADATWAWIELVQHRSPFPSLADVGYVLFYPALLACFASVPVGARTRAERVRVALDVASLVVAGIVAVWYFMLAPTLDAGRLTSFAQVLNVAYPVGDMLLVFAVGATLTRSSKSVSSQPLQWLAVATSCLLIGDLTFAQLSLNDRYGGSGLPDFWWTVGLGIFAVAAFVQIRRTVQVLPFTARLNQREAVPRISAAPYVGVGISCSLLVLVVHRQALYPVLGVAVGTTIVTLLVLARQLAAMTDNRRLVVAYRHLANTDQLTGLATRGRYLEVTALGLVECAQLSVLLIDIDHFKAINDEMGHYVGDQALRHVTAVCRAQTRECDSIAGRYGGDELVITLFDVNLTAAEGVAERLRRSIASEPLLVDDLVLSITVSIGVAESTPLSTNSESLIAIADRALYTAKREGRNSVRALSSHAAPLP